MKAILIPLSFAILFAGAALANTPDGETPAEESICNDYNGAGFGLCNAYCEAMDCHCFDDPDCEPAASQTACDKVASRFLKHEGFAISCVAAPACPCLDSANWPYGDETWARIATGNETAGYVLPLDSCNSTSTLGVTSVSGSQFVSVFEDPDPSDGDDSSCSWGDGSDGSNTQNTTFTAAVTAEGAAACIALLQTSCQ